MKIVGVNIWTDKENRFESACVSFDDGTVIGLDMNKPFSRKVLDFCENAKNHDSVCLSNGKVLNAFFD